MSPNQQAVNDALDRVDAALTSFLGNRQWFMELLDVDGFMDGTKDLLGLFLFMRLANMHGYYDARSTETAQLVAAVDVYCKQVAGALAEVESGGDVRQAFKGMQA